MDTIKKKVLASILNGKNKVTKSLNSYLSIEEKQKEKFDLESRIDLNSYYEEFQINLYNYYRSIKEDYNLIKEIIDKPMIIKSWKKPKSNYTFDELFRNYNRI